MHAPTVPCRALFLRTVSFCSGCKRCTQQFGSKVTFRFYGSKGKLSSVAVDLLCTRVRCTEALTKTIENGKAFLSRRLKAFDMHPADKLGRSRSPKMLSIPLVYNYIENSLPVVRLGWLTPARQLASGGCTSYICACVKLFHGSKVTVLAFCVGETARCIKHDR